MRRVFFVLIFSIAITNTYSQTILTVEEAIAAALQYNYDIQLVRNDSSIAGVDADLAWGAFLPNLSASATRVWNKNNQTQEFSDGRKVTREGVKTRNINPAIFLNWTLFDGLRMFATRDRLNELLVLGELNIKNQIVVTVTEVVRNYYDIVRQKQQLRAVEELMSISEERVKLAERKVSVGLGSKPELLQASVDLNAQKAAQLQQRTLILQLKERLNRLTGMKLPEIYEVADSIPIRNNINYGEIRENLEISNPLLQIARKNIDIANITLRENKAGRWPVIGVTAGYNFSRQVNSVVVNPAFALASQSSGLNYGLTASVPLLNNFLIRRNIKVSQLNIKTQQLIFENQRTLINVELSNAFKDYEYQKQALALEEENIALAKENVSIALERFRQGVSTFLELREAQISFEQANNRLIAARYNTKLAETELMRIKGDILQ